MTRYFVTGALTCVAMLSVAQNNVGQPDSISATVNLYEVEIKANPRIVRADRNVILPDHSSIAASANGLDLIGRLGIPRISVNRLTGEIGISGNGKVAVAINGVTGTSAELASIAPCDIIKIEHIDNPGPRYPDIDVLLNVVTRRHTSGGSIAVDMLNAFRKGGEADIDNLSLSYSDGKSQWLYTGQLVRLCRDNWTRDYSETRIGPNGTLEITETGMPSKMEFANVDNCMAYSVADDGRYLFNVKCGVSYNDVPHSEEADRFTLRTTSDDSNITEVYEHMGERSVSPSVDIYGLYRFRNGLNLIGNIVGTFISSRNNHTYNRSESGNNAVIDETSSFIKGRKYSLISEMLCSQQTGVHRFSIGMRHFQSYTDNKYYGDNESVALIHQARTTVYGQYSMVYDQLNLYGSLGAERIHSSQGNIQNSKWIFTPAVAVSWNPLNNLMFRYKVALRGKMPSLAEQSDIVRQIEPGYLRRGNPMLKPYRILEHELSVGWEWRWFSVDLSMPVIHEFKPVMESVVWNDGSFERTYYNQKSFTRIGAEATISIRPWKDHISLSLTPEVNHYRANGIDFNCSSTIHNLRIEAEINWKKWQLSYNTLTGYANYLYGARLMRERNMSMIMAGYKTGRYLLKAGVLDPFVKRYWMETRDMSPLVKSVSRAYSNNPTYLVIQVCVNMNFGKSSGSRKFELENADIDNGLLKGVK